MKTWIETCYDAIKAFKEAVSPPEAGTSSRGSDRASLTAERVRSLLRYDRDSGELSWIATGDRAGSIQDKGYRTVQIDGQTYYAHRIAWLHEHGVWPSADLDHINRNRDDNRIENLRDVSRSENNRNRRSWAKKDTEDAEQT